MLTSIKCKILLALVPFLVFGSSVTNGAQTDKPNVLLILVDDLKPALGSYGDPVAISPNIDRLAAQGMRFEMAYCNQSVCMASRYNLMLGSRSSSTGFYSFGTQFRDVYPDAVTLPQHFINNGYVAHSMGKVFHIGHGNTNDDASWSVPHHPDKVIDYVLPESNHRELTREEGLFTNAGRNASGEARPRGAAWEAADVLDEAYADGRVAATAIDRLRWLKENEEKPFFMAVGFVRPHLPFSAPKLYWDMYDRNKLPMPEFVDAPKDAPDFAVKRRGEIMAFKPIPTSEPFHDDLTRQLIHGYYASVTYMDAQVGKLLDGLIEQGFAENTIVVLWGDHGWHLGDHGSWTKHSNYEQANRIPIIISAPGVTKPGSVTHQLTETVDLYPTIASLAGLPAPNTSQPIDGLDMTPVLKNGQTRIRDYAYHSYPKASIIGRAIRNERYRIVEWLNTSTSEIVYELYDYQADPLEKQNVASSNPKALDFMKALLAKEPKAAKQVRNNSR
ncbi:MAG: sulfatase [Verrucomicrobia bacterium]|nr:sulfatase [Verrucomicrobiota bacterium]